MAPRETLCRAYGASERSSGIIFVLPVSNPVFRLHLGCPFMCSTELSCRRELDFQLFQGLSFGPSFDTFLHPFWAHVGSLFVFWALFGPSMGICWAPFCFLECLLSPRRRHCWLMGPFLLIFRSHLLLSGSIFGVHVALIWSLSRSV